EWAALFAADGFSDSCERMTQPLCERIDCERVGGPIKNCTRPTAAFRKSFEDATVEDVAIKGRKAAARFSNGETVEFARPSGLIHKIGGNAGREFLEGARSKSCGTWDRYRLVVEGDISCPDAIRVVNRDGYTKFPGSWFCDGPDGNVVCTQRTTEPGIVISACVPRSLRSWGSRRCSEMQRQATH
ncbi:MAG: hypothetical protein ACRD1H_18200, partial [Vicinamibacterales bacterium]